MTGPDLTPHWDGEPAWTGVLLLIVPAGRLPVPGTLLAQLVRDRIENDPALYDVVTVADGPSPDEFPDLRAWAPAVFARLVGAAMPHGHFLAPQGVLAVIVVGEDDDNLQRVSNALRGWELFERLRVSIHSCLARTDRDYGGVDAKTVHSLADTASFLIKRYDEHPSTAIRERTFLTEVVGFGLQGHLPWVEQSRERPRHAASSATATADGVATRMSPPAPITTPRTHPAPVMPPQPPAVSRPAPVPQLPSAPHPASTPPRVLRPPVFHHEDNTVVVDPRSTLDRVRNPSPTDAASIERIADTTDAVSLAYLVIVPDEEFGTRRLGKEHRTVAKDLDQLLATVVGDAVTGRRMRVAVEVLTATSPLHKHGVLRPAGELADGDIPKVRTEFFDHSKTVTALHSAAQRTVHAFHARNVEVLSLHFLFLSSVRLFDANTTGADWDSLLRGARVTWVEIGPARPEDTDTEMDRFRRRPQISPSPFGFHLISDRYDVGALVKEESAILYIYESPPAPVTRPPLLLDGPSVHGHPVDGKRMPITRKLRNWLPGWKSQP